VIIPNANAATFVTADAHHLFWVVPATSSDALWTCDIGVEGACTASPESVGSVAGQTIFMQLDEQATEPRLLIVSNMGLSAYSLQSKSMTPLSSSFQGVSGGAIAGPAAGALSTTTNIYISAENDGAGPGPGVYQSTNGATSFGRFYTRAGTTAPLGVAAAYVPRLSEDIIVIVDSDGPVTYCEYPRSGSAACDRNVFQCDGHDCAVLPGTPRIAMSTGAAAFVTSDGLRVATVPGTMAELVQGATAIFLAMDDSLLAWASGDGKVSTSPLPLGPTKLVGAVGAVHGLAVAPAGVFATTMNGLILFPR
jgi:hypothetical protein